MPIDERLLQGYWQLLESIPGCVFNNIGLQNENVCSAEL